MVATYGPASGYRSGAFRGSEGRARASALQYPNPFYDVAQMRLPANAVKELYEACVYGIHVDSLVAPTIRKMASYPITEIQLSGWDGHELPDETKAKWKRALHDHLRIHRTQIEMGISYYGLGNEILSIRHPFTKMVQCKSCKETFELRKLTPREHYSTNNYKIVLRCPKCSARKEPLVWDEYTRSLNGLRIKRWCIKDLDIEYYPFSGDREYYYTPSRAVRAQIDRCDPKAVCEMPVGMMDALSKGKSFRLDPRNVYHFRPPGIALDDPQMGWGLPLILPSLKDGYYIQLMKKAQEAILHEHMVPFRWLSPESTNSVDVFRTVNLQQWRREVENQVRQWKGDPNHITVFPLPLRMQQFGGQGKALMLVAEIKEMTRQRLASIGAPEEMHFGGLRWTASSVSLRMLENMFLTYRDMHHEFLNHFLIPQIARTLGYPRVRATMSQFKMGDDVQNKQLLLQLAERTKISDQRLLAEFGFDFREEQRRIDSENRMRAAVLMRQKAEEMHIQGEMSTLQAIYQRRLEEVAAAAAAGKAAEAAPPGAPHPGGQGARAAAGSLNNFQGQMGPLSPQPALVGGPPGSSPQADMRPPPQAGAPRRGGGTGMA